MQHVMIDLYGCSTELLANDALLRQVLDQYPDRIGMEKVSPVFLKDIKTSNLLDDGLSGFVIIATSHVSLLISSEIYHFLSCIQRIYGTSFTFVIASLSTAVLSRLPGKQRLDGKKLWAVEANSIDRYHFLSRVQCPYGTSFTFVIASFLAAVLSCLPGKQGLGRKHLCKMKVNFMKVQRIQFPEQHHISWMVIGDDYLPIEPINAYLIYLEHIESSSHTIRAYAHHLKLYWEYLQEAHLDWTAVGLSELANFISWLRAPQPGVVSMQEHVAKRSESTVNTIMSAVASMYDYHERTGAVKQLPLSRLQTHHHRRYKSFLHHITKSQPVKTRLLKLKTVQRDPKTLTREHVQRLSEACQCLRDRFLVNLLYETGMRIGQALGLRHEDLHSWDNVVCVVPRSDNANGARAKTREAYTIHVPADLMALYTDYLVQEFGETESDYVFVNLWQGRIGAPMKYATVVDLFERLGKKAGIADIHPHLLRHTHATELSRAGWDVSLVRKRLGHAQIQTTMRYVHLDDHDLKQAYQAYQKVRAQ